MLTNYHTHHHFCRHAIGNVEDYVKKAIAEKYDIIGISDHAPLPEYYNDRMTLDELPIYLEEIETCKQKYRDKIVIKAGLEIEYFSTCFSYYQSLNQRLDYLILAIHDFIYKNKRYCSYEINNDEILEGYFETLFSGIKSHFFSFAAHPDIFAFSYNFNDKARYYTEKLAQICLEEDFILEFNANGYRRGKSVICGEYRYPYPLMEFWDIIKKHNVKVMVNSDCHQPKLLNDQYEQYANEVARKMGLNIVKVL